jgi:cell division protein ZipA
MAELRWILLGAGLALIAGLYLWGMRSKLRSAATGPGRAAVGEPPATPPLAEHTEPAVRLEPQVRLEAPVPEVHETVPVIEAGDRERAVGRREPTLGQRLTTPQPQPQPRIDETGPAGPAPPASEDSESQTMVEARAQRIVALRVTAPLPSRFEGSLLHEALLAERFAFGRYQIFHRVDAMGRPVLSLASLREPGTFDPATMAGAAYAGVALFAVLPGPLSGPQAFEELLVAARALAGRLGGQVQDDRGVPLTMQRIARLREEMAAFDRARADAARR